MDLKMVITFSFCFVSDWGFEFSFIETLESFASRVETDIGDMKMEKGKGESEIESLDFISRVQRGACLGLFGECRIGMKTNRSYVVGLGCTADVIFVAKIPQTKKYIQIGLAKGYES